MTAFPVDDILKGGFGRGEPSWAISPEDHLRSINSQLGTPFGGGPVSQTFSALFWLEVLLRELSPAAALELGSGSGRVPLLLALHCPGHVVTCDSHELYMGGDLGRLYERLGITFLKKDVLHRDTAMALMMGMSRPRFVLCDNGNKPLEFDLYSEFLQQGDVIAVHDNPAEFQADSKVVTSLAEARWLTRWRRKELDADLTRLAVWFKA